MGSTKIIRKIDKAEFREWVSEREVKSGTKALFRLSEGQRNLFKEEELVRILKREDPVLIGEQKNGRYAAIYRRKEGFMRIVFGLKENSLEIVTFYITDTSPGIE